MAECIQYVFKRPFRCAVILSASDTLFLRHQCRKRLGWRKSARYDYKQIGSNSFRIEYRGWPIADVYKL